MALMPNEQRLARKRSDGEVKSRRNLADAIRPSSCEATDPSRNTEGWRPVGCDPARKFRDRAHKCRARLVRRRVGKPRLATPLSTHRIAAGSRLGRASRSGRLASTGREWKSWGYTRLRARTTL